MTADKLFREIDAHLMNDAEPSVFINEISTSQTFNESPFNMLSTLKTTGQSPLHHPEGSVWNHTLMVVDEAARRKASSSAPSALMWAALLHDIGKPSTTKVRNGKVTSYDHDKAGSKLAVWFLSELRLDENFIVNVAALVRWHMQVLFVEKSMSLMDIDAMKAEVDVFEIALLGLCDRLGRANSDRDAEIEKIKIFLKKCGLSEGRVIM